MARRDPRKTVNITVDLPSNRKLKGAPPATKWLGVVAVCWSAQNLSDGQIDPAVVCALAGVPIKHARDLIGRDMWHEKGHHCDGCPQPEFEGEVVIHDYLVHQTSASKIRRVAAERVEAGRRGNHTKHGHPGPFEECKECHE